MLNGNEVMSLFCSHQFHFPPRKKKILPRPHLFWSLSLLIHVLHSLPPLCHYSHLLFLLFLKCTKLIATSGCLYLEVPQPGKFSLDLCVACSLIAFGSLLNVSSPEKFFWPSYVKQSNSSTPLLSNPLFCLIFLHTTYH